MSICLTWFPISGLGEPEIYHNLVCFTRIWEGCGGEIHREVRERMSTNSPANPLLTYFTYSESLSILPLSDS
jgi:hypothetical protein